MSDEYVSQKESEALATRAISAGNYLLEAETLAIIKVSSPNLAHDSEINILLTTNKAMAKIKE